MAIFFVLVTLGVAAFLLLVAGKAARGRTSVIRGVMAGLAVWLGGTAMLAAQGFYRDFSGIPPRIAFAVIPAFLAVICLAASRSIRLAVARVPAWWLILAHVFRLPLEIALHTLYVDGVIPREMTYEGLNFDIVTGATAPLAAYVVWRGGKAAELVRVGWNLLGLALVTTITVVSILCTPSALQVFTSGPANTFVAEAPFIWLPAFIVPSAFLLHLWSLAAPRRMPRPTSHSGT